MKYLLSTIVGFFMLLTVAHSQNQIFTENFLGDEYKDYKGCLFKIKTEGNRGQFQYNFFVDSFKAMKDFSDDGIIYSSVTDRTTTERDSLKNKTYKVQKIIENPNGYHSNPIFKLQDTSTNEIVYFKYDQLVDSDFPFLVYKEDVNKKTSENLKINTDCDDISREVDDMTEKISLNSPLYSSVIIYKYIRKKSTVYYLSLNTSGSTCVVDGTGVIVLFTDGTKWIRSKEKIDVTSSTRFEYSAFISLSQKDLITFSTKKIKKFRLYIFDENVSSTEGEKFMANTKCILKSK